MTPAPLERFAPGSFDVDRHHYPKVIHAHLHPQLRHFLTLDTPRIAERFSHLHPKASREACEALLRGRTKHFRWGGADLLPVTDEDGRRKMVVIETNSCPSGQKSMPRADEDDERGGYRRLIQQAFLPLLKRRKLPAGGLAVLYDKNPMETTGYAATIADLTGEEVLLVPCFDGDPDPSHRFVDGVLQVRADGQWRPIRAAFRYVTLRPWNRIPPVTRTAMLNPVLACLAGGRNKLLAAKAYDLLDAELRPQGLGIDTPDTIWDASLAQVPMWVQRMGGVAVVKNPYSNAGQGVWTITNERELEAFRRLEHGYDRFIVQALIGNSSWSSVGRAGRLFHVGTLPDRRCRIHVADLRFMIGNGPDGFFPVAMYARRAREPLARTLTGDEDSWGMLGTNLSIKRADGSWGSQPERLVLMDTRDFHKLGLGLDHIIDAYLQTVLAVTAIDRMAQQLVNSKGRFRRRLFATLTPDPSLLAEIDGGMA
jgi:hypothetical protein